MNEPTSLRAGDSATWSRSLPDYPASAGWSLVYRLLWPSGTPVTIPTTVDASDILYTAAPTAVITAGFPVGAATLVWWVVNGAGDRTTLGRQVVDILPDLTTATHLDTRTPNQIALADARAALARYVAGGQSHVAEYTIAGRGMKFRSTAELQTLINYYETQVARDNAIAAAFSGRSSSVRVRM